MNKSIILRTAAALSISAALLCGGASCGMKDLLNIPITTYTVEHTDVENYISVSGTVEGSNIVKVTSDLTAKVKTLNVGVGDAVKAGDILCEFDSSDYQEQYDKLKDTADTSKERLDSAHEKNQKALQDAKNQKTDLLRKAQRGIDNAVSARETAYSKYDKLGKEVDECYEEYEACDDNAEAAILYKQYLAAQEQYEAFGDTLSSYDEAVQSARDAYNDTAKSADDAIEMAQEAINDEKFNKDTTVQDQLDKLKESIDKCVVKAPKDGVITSLSIAEGSFPTTEALMTIEDTTELRINVSINEADILSVKEGQKAVITTTATGDEEFTGKVERVVNIMSGQKMNAYTGEMNGGGYSAEIVIDKGADKLLIGMTAKAKIILDQKENVLAVPYDSIKQNDDGTFSVFIAEKNGDKGYKAKEVKVEKGMETNYLTEITSSELSDGDIVLTDVVANAVVDGGDVTIAEPYTDPDEAEKGE